jgi:hypothetical protein
VARDGRVQAGRRCPGLEADAGDVLAARPVGRSGTRRPLQVSAWRSPSMPLTLTCMRSTELSTKREVPWAVTSSPSTCQGSMAPRSSMRTPLAAIMSP